MLTEQELEAIQQRRNQAIGGPEARLMFVAILVNEDIPTLLDHIAEQATEIERLREIETLVKQMAQGYKDQVRLGPSGPDPECPPPPLPGYWDACRMRTDAEKALRRAVEAH